MTRQHADTPLRHAQIGPFTMVRPQSVESTIVVDIPILEIGQIGAVLSMLSQAKLRAA